MTDAQKRFCDEYLIDLNATRAYKVAYPNCKKDETARANGSRLLTKANIQIYVSDKITLSTNGLFSISLILPYVVVVEKPFKTVRYLCLIPLIKELAWSSLIAFVCSLIMLESLIAAALLSTNSDTVAYALA